MQFAKHIMQDMIIRRNISKVVGFNVGDKIELENAVVHGWSTDIYLVGYQESFNSVFFAFVDEDEEEYNIYSDSRFQTYF